MSGLGGAPPCGVCGQRVYFNEERNFMAQKWHKKCFKCNQCSKVLESGLANLDENNTLFCNPCYRKLYSAQKPSAPKQTYVNHEDPECCPRCGKKVYFAEQVLSLGRKWHKLCFSCAACNKKVDSSSATDHEGELYCKSCHGRKFGPKGYGYAGGAGTMLSMDSGKAHEVVTDNVPHTAEAYMAPVTAQNGESRKPKWGGGDYCPRCGKQVFLAEKRAAAGKAFHATCFTCFSCRSKLDSGKLTEKEGEVYCKACYGRQFGPKGYGFGGGAGALKTA